jgi:hypothetical protein
MCFGSMNVTDAPADSELELHIANSASDQDRVSLKKYEDRLPAPDLTSQLSNFLDKPHLLHYRAARLVLRCVEGT